MGLGQMANWSYPYVGGRPRDILGISEAVEAKCKQFIGWSGKSPDGTPTDHFTIIVLPAETLDLTDFAATPIGTRVEHDGGTHPTIAIHKAKSDPAVVGDWEVLVAATGT